MMPNHLRLFLSCLGVLLVTVFVSNVLEERLAGRKVSLDHVDEKQHQNRTQEDPRDGEEIVTEESTQQETTSELVRTLYLSPTAPNASNNETVVAVAAELVEREQIFPQQQTSTNPQQQQQQQQIEPIRANTRILKQFQVVSEESDLAYLDHCNLEMINVTNFSILRSVVMNWINVTEQVESLNMTRTDITDEITLQTLEFYARAAGVCDFALYRPPTVGVAVQQEEKETNLQHMAASLPMPPEDQVRIVFLISAFQDLDHLKELIRAVHLPQHLIVIHLERRSPDLFARQVRSYASEYSNVAVVQFGSIVYETDSLSQINHQLMRFVTTELSLEYDFLITLSSTAYPLYDAHDLARYLKAQPKRIRLGTIIYNPYRAKVYCRKILESFSITLSRGNGQKGFANLRNFYQEMQSLHEQAVLPSLDAFATPHDRFCRHKTISGNTAIYDRDAIVGLLSPNATELLTRFKQAGRCCMEEFSWGGALTMIGREDEIAEPGMMWQAWRCYSALNNIYLTEQTDCGHVLDSAGGNVKGGRKIYKKQGLEEELTDARARGQLFARKFKSDQTYWMRWIQNKFHSIGNANSANASNLQLVDGIKRLGPSILDQLTGKNGTGSKDVSPSSQDDKTQMKVASNLDQQVSSGDAALPPAGEEIQIKVPFPVFVASLYKSGTTSLHSYFKCGGQRAVHYGGGKHRTGPCMERNWKAGKPLFQGCGSEPFDIWSDNNNLRSPYSCYDPSVYSLDALYKHYPNATILLAVRDSYGWIDSVERYAFGTWSLLEKLKKCPDLWPTQKEDIGRKRSLTKDEIRQFYLWQVNHVRDFAKAHPSMTYIEVQLESNQTGFELEKLVGIPERCWGNKNHNTKKSKKA